MRCSVRRGAALFRPHPDPVTNGSAHPDPGARATPDQPKHLGAWSPRAVAARWATATRRRPPRGRRPDEGPALLPGGDDKGRNRVGTARSSSSGTGPASRTQPDRPSPQSQSLSRSYGSDLPTSLTHLVLTCQRLFTLETCCGYGYGPARDLHLLPRIFKGQREFTGRRRNRGAFQGTGPYLGANPFQGALPFTKKRELFPGPPPASPSSFALPHWTPRGACLRHSGFGDLNPIPFRSAGGDGGHRPTLRNGVRLSLRTD
ncbi:hypothetical protein AALO_G00309980 [Alosa alosa]|uniref:Uncharacterized protein n=1 Tax=Alosa alosa TaxID=278164 RepID=A0AAV6FJ56_9TELE|nr:hypothetical protein AALO_G00309980 [Alosa alosa]